MLSIKNGRFAIFRFRFVWIKTYQLKFLHTDLILKTATIKISTFNKQVHCQPAVDKLNTKAFLIPF